jgi:ceramide glucosyltransferase
MTFTLVPLSFHILWLALAALAAVGLLSSTVFLLMTIVAEVRHVRWAKNEQAKVDAMPASAFPPVTILKPVHGAEEQLFANLESFFQQDYPNYEVIFGVRDAENPAARVAEEVRRRHPNVPCRIIFSGPPAWPNAKVFSLDKMIAASANQYFIISDSDVRVAPDFLRNAIAPLLDHKVGLITCMYRGIPASDFWSSLEALGLSVEMSSGVMVADMLEGMRFALGPAMAVRRDAMDAIGGIQATADYYSDDFELGNRIWAKGFRVVLSHHIVKNVLTTRPLWRTLGDQLRWMKSTRYSRPAGHVGTGLTYAVPFGVLALLSLSALGHWKLGLACLAATWLNRMIQSVVVGWGVTRDPRSVWLCWLYPLRDLLGFLTWTASFTSRNFYWRGETYRFGKGGRIAALQRPSNPAADSSR